MVIFMQILNKIINQKLFVKSSLAVVCALALVFSCAGSEKSVKKEPAEPVDEVITGWNVKIPGNAGTQYKIYWIDKSLRAEGPVAAGMKNGPWKFYYKGTKAKLMAEVPFKSDLIEGEVKEYYPSGRLQSKAKYKNGILNGSLMTFYESGIGKIEEYYKDGVKNGKSFEYFENGMTKENAYFVGGIREGMSMTFHRSGKKKAAGRFHAGKKEGLWEHYSEQGILESKGHYKNDEQTGVWNFYDKKGMKIEEKKFD